jgi:hypothetical protein
MKLPSTKGGEASGDRVKATQDRQKAHQLLDAAGAPESPDVSARIEAAARFWLERTAPGALHSEGCACRLCAAARAVLKKVHDS